MKAVILAGGKGTRLRPLTELRPKPLIPVAGRPCIEYVIRSLVEADIRRIIITTGYRSDLLIRHLADGSLLDANLLYAFESSPLGTAGSVRNLGEFLDSTFVVASGDVLSDIDITALLATHRETGAKVTMALTEVENPSAFGIVELDDADRVVRFAEKPPPEEVFSNLINAGIYVIEPEVLEGITPGEPYDFSRQLFPALLERGIPIYGHRLQGIWHDIGNPGDLLGASLEVVAAEGSILDLEGVEVTGKVLMGRDVIVEKGAELRGPVFLGDRSFVSRGAVVERSCLYEGTFIDRGCRILESILLPHCQVGWQSNLRTSIIGERCSIEYDVTLENSIIGDGMTVKKHTKMTDANVTQPAD